jgi:signal transduction histidine kinase
MEEVYFVLGMVTVLVVLGILAIVTIKNKIEEMEKEIQYLDRGSHDVAVDLHRRIDDEVRMLQSNIDENERDLLSHIDSRLNEKK